MQLHPPPLAWGPAVTNGVKALNPAAPGPCAGLTGGGGGVATWTGTQRLEPEAPEVQGGPRETLGPTVRGPGRCLRAGSPGWWRPRRGPVRTAWRGAKATPGPLCWTRRQSEAPGAPAPGGSAPSARGRTKPTAGQSPRQDKTRLEGGGARWHLPGRERLGGGGRRAGGLVGQTHAPPACLEPRQARDGHLGRRSGGRAREPQLPPWEHLRAALPAKWRPRVQLQTEGGRGGGTLHSLVIREASTRQTGRHALLALKQTICHFICPHAAPTTWEMPATPKQSAPPQASPLGNDSPSCLPPPPTGGLHSPLSLCASRPIPPRSPAPGPPPRPACVTLTGHRALSGWSTAPAALSRGHSVLPRL